MLADLRELVRLRNKLAHRWLLLYRIVREREGESAIQKGIDSLNEQGVLFVEGWDRVMRLAHGLSEGPLDREAAVALWGDPMFADADET